MRGVVADIDPYNLELSLVAVIRNRKPPDSRLAETISFLTTGNAWSKRGGTAAALVLANSPDRFHGCLGVNRRVVLGDLSLVPLGLTGDFRRPGILICIRPGVLLIGAMFIQFCGQRIHPPSQAVCISTRPPCDPLDHFADDGLTHVHFTLCDHVLYAQRLEQ
jgi:hypothetical protein